MAVNKNQSGSVSSLSDMGTLMKPGAHTSSSTDSSKEGNMPNTKKAAAAAASEAANSDTTVLEHAEAAGYDITKPHPKVLQFVSALNPFEASNQAASQNWIMSLAAGSAENPMTVEQFIVESHRDPENFIMHLAANQGAQNVRAINRVEKLTVENGALIQQLADAKQENFDLNVRVSAMNVNGVASSAMHSIGNDTAKLKSDTQQHAARLSLSDNGFHLRERPMVITGASKERVTLKVEEPGYWELAAKAVVTGVVAGAAAYGTIKLIEHFFGDDQQ